MVLEELEARKFIGFHVKHSTLTRNFKPTITGRHPRSPKNLAGQKVSLKLSPTTQWFGEYSDIRITI